MFVDSLKTKLAALPVVPVEVQPGPSLPLGGEQTSSRSLGDDIIDFQPGTSQGKGDILFDTLLLEVSHLAMHTDF
jgi:hypothetical protein